MATVPAEHNSRNTTFFLDYRQANPDSPSYGPSKLPNLPTLCQFLATSLTFVGLQTIELHVDAFKVAFFKKILSPADEIRVPGGLKDETAGQIFRVSKVSRQRSQIDAQWDNVMATAQNPPKRAVDIVQAEVKSAGHALKSFFSKFSQPSTAPSTKVAKQSNGQEKPVSTEEEVAGESKGVIFLSVSTIEVVTRVSRKFSAEIERATKKPPPRQTRIQLLTSPYHDSSAPLASGAGSTAKLASKIFEQVLPSNAGRIFIGFPTAQTTPFLTHISAPSLIPTVERENVDMNAPYISTWNTELLRVAGLACRISYSLDMAELRDRLETEPIAKAIPHAAYICKQYTAKLSHPSTVLGQRVDEAFFECSKERSIAILSTNGIKSSQTVRMPAETLSFLGQVPMVPHELATQAVDFFVSLHKRGFISELTMTDIRNGLDNKALSEDELIDFLKWCGSKLESEELDASSVRSLFEVTIADIGGNQDSGKLLALGAIKTYVNASRINPGLPIPPDTIPFNLSKAVPLKQLQLFGWRELPIATWLQFLTTQPQLSEFQTSEQLAMQVLGSAAKSWDQLDNSSKEIVIKTLKPHPIMPTKMGMCRPEDSYFPTVKLFDDLPTVKPFTGSKDKFLLALGVRRTVDLAKVFERMKTQDASSGVAKGTWRHGDLIRYFASVINEIPKNDMDRLKETAFLPGEGRLVKEGQVFKAHDLYAPKQAILSLGLTQVKLPFEFKASSKEAILLFRLGLREHPGSATIAEILHRAGKSKDEQLWLMALTYFLDNYFANGYAIEQRQFAAVKYAILPTLQSPFPDLVAPVQCFSNERAACFGYPILRADLKPHADKFGVSQDPPVKDCIQRLLMAPPKTKRQAEEVFSYLASRSGEVDQQPALIQEISGAKIVPIMRTYFLDSKCGGFEDRSRKQSGPTELRVHHYDPPQMVFVGMDREYRNIIDYVNFSAEATAFLLKVGAKHEPNSHDLAMLICKDASSFLTNLGHDRYLDLLRKLSDHAEALFKNKDLVQLLSSSRVLLGYRDIRSENQEKLLIEGDLDELDDVNSTREWSLNRADEVIIIDDIQHMYRFQQYIIAAPQEEQLELFYAKLGSKTLSTLVKSERNLGAVTRDQAPAQKLRNDILERTRLFLHEFERDASAKSIRHDAKWLSQNLTVKCVSNISIRYSLPDRNVSTSSPTTAVIVKYKLSGLTLWVTPKYDLYDVSRELVDQLIRRPKQNDVIALERILAESLRRLQAKGINVERILKRKEQEARIAEQQELAKFKAEQEERQRQAEQAKGVDKKVDEKAPVSPKTTPATPERPHKVPGSFESPEADNSVSAHDNQSSISDWARKLWRGTGGADPPTQSTTPKPESPKRARNKSVSDDRGENGNVPQGPQSSEDSTISGPQISADLQITKANITNAIQDCKPTNAENINAPHHQDPPTQLDSGGYCSGRQFENLRKAFNAQHSGYNFDIYYGKHHQEPLSSIQKPLAQFLPLIFGLINVFGINPSAVNIFLDNRSNTVAFNLNKSLFFNLAWFMELHADNYHTSKGKQFALDSWFLTFCHELAHNLVSDHNARHNWYNQQFAIEFSPKYRAKLAEFLTAAVE